MNILPYPKQLDVKEGFCLNVENIQYIEDSHLEDNGYKIDISKAGIDIFYKDKQAKHYASITLNQVLKHSEIPCLYIHDYPHFKHRGVHIDVCRYNMSVNELKKLIDMISLFKFNVLHLHLNDEQGWRIEIDEYPKLCEIGSKRSHSDYGRTYDPKPHVGFYTKEDIRNIVKYAKEKEIDIIPEIEVPGHCSSILAGYPSLGCQKQEVKVKTRGGVYKEILCAGKEDVYIFIKKVLDEVCELFPYPYFHLGADEAQKDHWRECPDCQKRLKEHHLETIAQLQDDMVMEFVEYLKTKGKRVTIFSDGLRKGNLYKDIDYQYWVGDSSLVQEKIYQGSEVIDSTHGAYYLDLPYGQTSLSQTFHYNPYDKFSRVKGIEGMIWREFLPDFDSVLHSVFPRLLAVSETAWNANDKIDYDQFIKNVEFILEKYPEIKAAPRHMWDMSKIKKIKNILCYYHKTMTREDRKQFINTLKNERKEKKENEAITTNK